MVFHWCLYNKQNITCPLMDMNFIFSWSTRYLTRSLRSLVRYRVDHSKIKFISTRGHVISSIYFELFDKYFDFFAVIFACNFTYIFGSVVCKLISLTVRLGFLWFLVNESVDARLNKSWTSCFFWTKLNSSKKIVKKI